MRTKLCLITFLLVYPVSKLHALPNRCPKIDQAMLKAGANYLVRGGELSMNTYRWKVTGGNICHPTCGENYTQALQPKVKSRSTLTTENDKVTCTYQFVSNDNTVIADLVVVTDQSKKLPEHSYQLWNELPSNPEEFMKEEQRRYRDDPRVRME